MLIHGGVNDQSGVEPDNLWSLSLDAVPVWTQIVPQDTLRGRSYPVYVYDPVDDALLACGGGSYPLASELSLSAPLRWRAVLPASPLPSPSLHTGNAVIRDSRRDRFLIVGGSYSPVDSATWEFDPVGASTWRLRQTSNAPWTWFSDHYQQSSVYDSLGDRVIFFDGWQVWSLAAVGSVAWAPLGPPAPYEGPVIGPGAGVALDTRRNRLILSGGWKPYPHGAGYTYDGVWALSLGSEPSWSLLGTMPTTSALHAAYYDPVHDRLVVIGGFQVNDSPITRHSLGSVVWSTPADSVLRWTLLRTTSGEQPPAPPDAQAEYDPLHERFFMASDSTVWSRGVDDTGPWTRLELSSTRPSISSAIAYDQTRDQLLALFAQAPGSPDIQAWALALGPLSVSLLRASRSPGAASLTWQSVTAVGHVASVERRQEGSDWQSLGPLVFSSGGLAAFTDHDVVPQHDYSYRVSVIDGAAVWHSEPAFAPDPSSLQLTLFGARPNPALGSIVIAFSLPAAGPAQLDVFDIRGRRCLSIDVGPFGPGRHTIGLGGSASWRPGVYFARLKRGDESRTTPLVLMR